LKNGKNNLTNLLKLDAKFKTLGMNTLIFGIGNILSKLILFLLMPLYTSFLTPTQYGTAELLNNSVDLIMPFITLCLYEAVFRFSIDNIHSTKEAVFSNSLRLLLKSLVATIVVCIAISLIASSNYPLLFLSMLIPYSLRQIFAQFSRGIGYSKEFAISGILNALALGLVSILLVGILKQGVQGYIFSIAIGNLFSASYLFFRLKLYKFINISSKDSQLVKRMLTYSLPMIPNSVSWWFANISTRYILMFFEGVAIAGIFTAISKLPSIINMLSSIFQQAWQFSASKEIKQKESSKFFSKVFSIYYTLIILACSYLITFIPMISRIVLKGEFFLYWYYVPLLLVSAVLNCLSVYFGSIYTAAMNNKMIMISTLSGALVSIISSILLIPTIGILGAIVASNLSYIVVNVMRYIDTKKIIKIKIDFKQFLSLFFLIYIQAIGYIIFNKYFFIYSLAVSFLITITIIWKRFSYTIFHR